MPSALKPALQKLSKCSNGDVLEIKEVDVNDDEVKAHQKLLDEEAQVKEKVDSHGNRWRKVYFGGGVHFQNWLDQSIELCGKQNVDVEEVAVKGLQCFEQGGEKMYRIWVKETKTKL